MPAYVALVGLLVSGSLAVLSFFAVKEAERKGRLRFLFWHIRGWGEREQSPGFFKLGLAGDKGRTVIFAMTAVLFAFYLLGALVVTR